MILAILLARSLVQASTITVTFPPTPLPQALAILSKETGRRLEAAPALSEEVALARLKDAPVDKALAHLAESLCAKWVERPDGVTRLVPDPVASRKLDEADAARREEFFQEAITYLKRRLSEEPEELDLNAIKATKAKKEAEILRREAAERAKDYDNMWPGSKADEEAPMWRAAARIALMMDRSTLLGMPVDSREVWAENPTAMQHAFPDGADQVLAQYRREFSLVNPTESVARFKFTVQNEFGQLWARTVAYDAAGNIVDKDLVALSRDEDREKVSASKLLGYTTEPNETPIVLPQDAREARIALSSVQIYRKPDRAAILEKWRPKLLDPVHFEPTHWHVGEDLVLAAEGLQKNLIGTVDDFIGGKFELSGELSPGRKTTPSQILLKHKSDLVPSDDGWLLIRSNEKEPRLSRSISREFLADGVRKGGITVDALAGFVMQTTEPYKYWNWVTDYMNVLFSGRGTYNDFGMVPGLEFWGGMGPGVVNRLSRGETIRLSSLTADAQSWMAKMVYWYRWLDDEGADPTEKLPNGIVDGTLSMTIADSPLVTAWSSTTSAAGAATAVPTENIGRSYATGDKWFRAFDRFRIGVHRTFDLHFVMNPGQVPMTVSFEESLMDPDTQTLTELPAKVKADIEKWRLEAIAHPQEPGEYPPSKPPVRKVIPPL